MIAKHAVRVYDEFPPHTKGTFVMGWGIANDFYGETWALTRSGLFCYWKEFRENNETADRTGYRGGADARAAIPSGEWLEYSWAIRTMVDFFLFLSRFSAEYGPGEEIQIDVKAGPIAGRRLISLNPDIVMGYGAPSPCRSPYFSFPKTTDTETLRANWEPVCAGALRQLVELFPDQRIEVGTLLKWVERYRTRQS